MAAQFVNTLADFSGDRSIRLHGGDSLPRERTCRWKKAGAGRAAKRCTRRHSHPRWSSTRRTPWGARR